jgi:hypothetical protein
VSAARVAVYLAVAACAVWALKALVIWNAGGLDESALEGPLFALGLLLVVVTFAALAVSFVRAGLPWRVLAGLAGALVGLGWVLVIESLVGGAAPDTWGWVQEEVGLWVAAALALAVTLLRAARA